MDSITQVRVRDLHFSPVHMSTSKHTELSTTLMPQALFAGFVSSSSAALLTVGKERSGTVLPDISALSRKLQEQWDVTANAHLGNVVIAAFSGQKVWWQCRQCPDGHLHQWQANVASRSCGSSCPQCEGRKLCRHNSLVTVAPKVAALWDIVKNGCTADMVLAHSHNSSYWQCHSCGHEWTATPNVKVSYSTGCPKCNHNGWTRAGRHPTFAQCQHPLLSQWDHPRNAAEGLYPDTVTLGSTKKVHWVCDKCPLGHQHAWASKPRNRLSANPTGCPCCAGRAACKCNSLQTHHPSIAEECDYKKNDTTPQDFTFGSNHVVWWHTVARGSWQQSINSRTSTVRRSALKQQTSLAI